MAAALTLASAQSHSISGQVVFHGRPVPHARVEVVRDLGEIFDDVACPLEAKTGSWAFRCGSCPAADEAGRRVVDRLRSELRPIGSLQTNESGQFSFEHLPAGTFALWITAPERLAVVINGLVPGVEPLTAELRAGQAIVGLVLDAEARPVGSQPVTVILDGRSRIYEVTTGVDGLFKIDPAPLGDYSVIAVRDGFLPEVSHVDLGLSHLATPRVELRRPSIVRASVIDRARGGDVRVTLANDKARFEAVADSEGRATFVNVRPGLYWIQAQQDELGAFAMLEVAGETTAALQLSHIAMLDVRVHDHEGRPIRGAAVNLGTADDRYRKGLAVVTNDDGIAHAGPLPPVTFGLFPETPGHAPLFDAKGNSVEKTIEQGQRNVSDLSLDRTLAIPGTLTDSNGVPVFNAWVGGEAVKRDASGRLVKDDGRKFIGSDNTDASGHFSLRYAKPGSYLVSVRGRTVPPFSLLVDVPTEPLFVQAPKSFSVRGTVLDVRGQPIEGARVSVGHMPDQKFPNIAANNDGRSIKTGPAGEFVVDGLPDAPVEISAVLDDLEAGGKHCTPTTPEVTQTINAGKISADLVLRLPKYECLVH